MNNAKVVNADIKHDTGYGEYTAEYYEGGDNDDLSSSSSSSGSSKWYYNIETTKKPNEPGVTPHDVINSKQVRGISYK